MKIFQLFQILALALVLSACGEESNYSVKPQDMEFIAKITSHLHKKGDRVKVSDVHPGDWERVCINPIGMYSNIEVKVVKGEGLRSNGLKISNGAITYANDKVWGIYFRYPHNTAEYYRIPWDSMYPRQEVELKPLCADKETAFFEAVGDFENRKSVNPVAKVSPDFIEIQIINSNEERK